MSYKSEIYAVRSASRVIVARFRLLEGAMKRIAVGLLIAVVVLLGLASAQDVLAQAACLQFLTWEDAQATHLSAPWLGLDPDGNGVACDCLLHGFPC
jgi:hypothetical protein